MESLCQVFVVSRSAYYDWLKAGSNRNEDEKKRDVEELIISIFQEHRRHYGVRKVAAELKGRGIKVSAYQVRKTVKAKALKAIQPRSFVPKTTDSRHPYPISPNLLLKRSAPVKPNEVWVGDITYIPLINGNFLYLGVWMDLYSRRIIGWQLYEHMKEELIIEAFKKVLCSRSVTKGLIVHSDRGGQYAGNKFR